MKKGNQKIFRSFTAMLLVICMMVGLCPASFAMTVNSDDGIINYVSLGDSMTNGYGLDGYETEEGLNVNGFLQQVPESYPVLFKNWLQETTGNEVELTQLATSALRAEDFAYILTYGTDKAFPADSYTLNNVPSRFDNVAGYDNVEALAELFQTSVKNADVISIGVGSNNFSTFMTQRLSYCVGKLNTEFNGMFGGGYRYDTDLERLIELADEKGYYDEKVKAEVQEIYNLIYKEFEDSLAEEGISLDYELNENGFTIRDFANEVGEAAAYTFLGYMLGYKSILDYTIEVNPDADIIVIGLSNWLEGLTVSIPFGEEEVIVPIGDALDEVYEIANLYTASLPAVYEALAYANEEIPSDIYYAEAEYVELLADQMKDEQKVPTNMTRKRMVRDICTYVFGMMGGALPVAQIDLEDVEAYEETLRTGIFDSFNMYLYSKYGIYNPADFTPYYVSCVTYLGIEASFIETLDLEVFDASSFITLATTGGLQSVVMEAISKVDMSGNVSPDMITDAMTSTPTLQGLVNLFATYISGDGVLCHPSAAGHEAVFHAIVNVYENEYTAGDYMLDVLKVLAVEIKDLLVEYGPVALEALYNYGVEEGYIDPQEVAYWTGRLEAWKEGWNSAETDEEKLQVCKDIAWELYQTAVKKGLIDDEAVQNTIDEVKAVVNEIISALEEIKETLENIDVAEIKLQLLNNLKSMLEDMASEIDPEVIAEIESVIETVKNLSKEDVEAFVEAYLANQTTKLFELVYDATNGEYAITGNDYYVAIGGNTVSGIGVSRNEATYTELLQDTLGIDGIVLSEENLSGKNIVEYINANKDEIAKATLITYQLDASDLVMSVFANDVELNADLKAVVEATTEVIKAGLASFDGSVDTVAVTAEIEAEIPDEVKVKLNEAGFEVAAVVETVANAVETIWAEVEAAGDSAIVALNDIDTETVEMVCDLAAEVVYAGITYVTGNIAGIEAIQAINPDALLIVAGMYNPLQGLSVTVGETTVDIGEIFGYVIEATDLYNLVYAIGNGNVVFVDVSEAETDGVNENIALDELTTESMLSLAGKFATLSTAMHANAEGHEYIYERIMNALTITVPVLYGDADGNGVVNSIDAMVVLQYDVELIGEDEIDLIAGDVDGDGVVNSIDAMLILQYDVELITEFPVETIAA